MNSQVALPSSLSQDKPNPARVYDYLLGGYHNFEHDRQSGERLIQNCPDLRTAGHAQRAFLRRAVRFLCEQGIDQFIDLGSGLPTCGNVHEIAQAIIPTAHVVYVDIDPVAVAHSQMILQNKTFVTAIQADVCQPQEILDHAEVRRLIDLQRRAAVLCFTILHYVVQDQLAYHVVGAFASALAPGSYIAISHATLDDVPPEILKQLERFYTRVATPLKPRTQTEIARFFDGLDLAEPGLVCGVLWRPEGPDDLFLDEPGRCQMYVGVGRKP